MAPCVMLYQRYSQSTDYFMNKLDKIFSQSENVGAFATGYLNYLNQVLAGFNVEDISAFVNILKGKE